MSAAQESRVPVSRAAPSRLLPSSRRPASRGPVSPPRDLASALGLPASSAPSQLASTEPFVELPLQPEPRARRPQRPVVVISSKERRTPMKTTLGYLVRCSMLEQARDASRDQAFLREVRSAAWQLRESSGRRGPGTEGGTRTLTFFRTADFESAASTVPPLRLARDGDGVCTISSDRSGDGLSTGRCDVGSFHALSVSPVARRVRGMRHRGCGSCRSLLHEPGEGQRREGDPLGRRGRQSCGRRRQGGPAWSAARCGPDRLAVCAGGRPFEGPGRRPARTRTGSRGRPGPDAGQLDVLRADRCARHRHSQRISIRT